jgi:DDE superfamily endonuclease
VRRAAACRVHREGRELRHVFSAYVTAGGQAWADFDVYMPERWADDLPRRRAAGIPADLKFTTKPQLAIAQVRRLRAAGLPAGWAAAVTAAASRPGQASPAHSASVHPLPSRPATSPDTYSRARPPRLGPRKTGTDPGMQPVQLRNHHGHHHRDT